jgi:predicted nuclease of predicted toxin-antitoxin system
MTESKLLFDENLSPRLVSLLTELFPESVHVMTSACTGVRMTICGPTHAITA